MLMRTRIIKLQGLAPVKRAHDGKSKRNLLSIGYQVEALPDRTKTVIDCPAVGSNSQCDIGWILARAASAEEIRKLARTRGFGPAGGFDNRPTGR
jgi:hypothetical protein